MKNEYRFACPVAEGVVCAQDCADTHNAVMCGHVRDVEPRCAIAHRAGKCIWAILERRSWQAGQPVPFSAKETSAQTISEAIVNQALSGIVTPTHCQGIGAYGSHVEFFEKLTAQVPHVESKVRAPRRSTVAKTPAPVENVVKVEMKPKTALDAVAAINDDRAEVLNKRIAKEEQGSAQNRDSVPSVTHTEKTEKPASALLSRSQSVSVETSGMTLADRVRAARMKG